MIVKAIRYKNLDEARAVLKEALGRPPGRDIFDDGGHEPEGLLSLIPEDRLPGEEFFRLFSTRKGTLIEVERIPYSGFGPPAAEEDYIGFITEQIAYVVKGSAYDIRIHSCPLGAVDIHHLEAMVLDGEHPLRREYLGKLLNLAADWSFDDLFDLIAQNRCSGDDVDQLIHREES